MIRLLFWFLIILFIIGIINSSINIQTIEQNFVITIDYVNFVDNTIASVEGITSFVSEIFASTEEATPVSPASTNQ